MQRDPALFARLIEIQDKMLLTPTNPNILDYQQRKYYLKTARDEILTGETAARAFELSQKLKNVIMQVLLKNRETRKVPKLKDILKDAIERQQKAQALKRN